MPGRVVLYAGTRVTSFPPKLRRKSGVSSVWNLGSEDSIHRKNLSFEARANSATLKTGWYGFGSPFMANILNMDVRAENRIMHSNVIGMNAGQLFVGRPPTLWA